MRLAREKIAALGKPVTRILLNPTEYERSVLGQPGCPPQFDGIVVHRSLFAPDGGTVVFLDGSTAPLKEVDDGVEQSGKG